MPIVCLEIKLIQGIVMCWDKLSLKQNTQIKIIINDANCKRNHATILIQGFHLTQ